MKKKPNSKSYRDDASPSSPLMSSWPEQPAGATSSSSPLPPQPHPYQTKRSTKGRVRGQIEQEDIEPISAYTSTLPEANRTVADTHTQADTKWLPVKEVTVCNFKAVSKATISLGSEVTILVGANASGKSSVLQAIHWSTKLVYSAFSKGKNKEISFEKMDYVPSGDPIGTLHNGRLQKKAKHPSIGVIFQYDHKEALFTRIDLRASQGMNGINTRITGDKTLRSYIQSERFVSAYIPGLVGLSENEKKESKKHVWRSASSGEAGSYLRNILLLLSTTGHDDSDADSRSGGDRLDQLNSLVNEIFPELMIEIKYDESFDNYISVNVSKGNGHRWALESTSSGVLKVIQIFAYIVYFRPRITLIEEPDSHLHPRAQRQLIEMLERAAITFNTQVIVTTHSPHIVQGASTSCSLEWINSGGVVAIDSAHVRKLMGWSGLDISVIFFVEDRNCIAIDNILRQWPEIYNRVGICPVDGVGNLPRPSFVRTLLREEIFSAKVVVHRDGDFMTKKQANYWKDEYSKVNAFAWVTSKSDVEEYYCSPKYLSKLYGIDEGQATDWIDDAIDLLDSDRSVRNKVKGAYISKKNQNFRYAKKKKRTKERKEKYNKDTRDSWESKGISRDTVTGKTLHEYLVIVVGKNGKDESLLESFVIPTGYDKIAVDLKCIISNAINSDYPNSERESW